MAKKSAKSPKRTGAQFVNPAKMKPPGMMQPEKATPVKLLKGKGMT